MILIRVYNLWDYGSFCVSPQPMGDGRYSVTSLAERMHEMIPKDLLYLCVYLLLWVETHITCIWAVQNGQ